MFLGCHISIAGGFDKCIDRIAERGGNCLQTFATSPRSLQKRVYTDTELTNYHSKKMMYGISQHFFHAPYPINLGSSDPDYLRASVEVLRFYTEINQLIGGSGTVVHIGSHEGRGFSAVKDQILFVLSKLPLILENTAGESGKIGTLEELSQLITPNTRFCLDTQHAFASGIPIKDLLDRFDQLVGINNLAVIHFNDSKSHFGSHLDRHQNLTEGQIETETLREFINDPRIKDIPIILEVPGENHNGPRKEDIDTLKELINT